MHIHMKISGLSKESGYFIVNDFISSEKSNEKIFGLLTQRASIEKPQVHTM